MDGESRRDSVVVARVVCGEVAADAMHSPAIDSYEMMISGSLAARKPCEGYATVGLSSHKLLPWPLQSVEPTATGID